MEQFILSDRLTVSRFALGFWRLMEWNYNTNQLTNFIETAIDMGITTFDHADIYGNYQCEAVFGTVLKQNPHLRKKMQLVTKCAIRPMYHALPEQKVKFYDTRYSHIIESVNRSLKNLNTDYIDLLLIHRPDPLMHPDETGRAFEELYKAGKVFNFGVSNFSPLEFDMLNNNISEELVTNQVEISPYCLEHFENGNMTYFLKEKIHPMAWSPLSGGKLIHPDDEKSKRIHQTLIKICERMDIKSVDTLIYAWLLYHPSGIIPVIGSGKAERLQNAVHAFDVKMNHELWYEIYEASLGEPVP